MLGRSILPGDEELGKKDDDHIPRAALRWPAWDMLRAPRRWRRRRILLALAGLYLVYLFVHNIPDLGESRGWKRGYQPYGRATDAFANQDSDSTTDSEPTGAPPGLSGPKNGDSPAQTYSGQIRFYRLAVSLHGASHTGGYRPINRNVLFAISNLQSASTLLPMACEMSKWNRNWVHVAFMGREDIPLDDLLQINGIDKERCPAIWHDARPDFTEYSSEIRAESSVMAALGHIHEFLHPQVAIVDDSSREEGFHVQGMRRKTRALDMPIIEVPKDRLENFMWITRLDAGSLRNWHRPSVDIMIQVPSDSTGGIMRLLKSLKEADYNGLKPPRLTIELPASIDISVQRYLEGFSWPPKGKDDLSTINQITLRRRIMTQRTTQEESAVRFLELYYPTSASNSHVLLLSPNAQVSPLYYHYLKFVLLEYIYSAFGEDDSEKIMGVSLELPSLLLDGTTKLTPPTPADMHAERYTELFPKTPNSQFLWQAPNSHATLFFGNKWSELHSFLSNRVAKQHGSAKTAARVKLVSETLPSWTEYMLELMRARGYSIFYPATSSAESFATVHNELYRPPDEYLPQPPSGQEQEAMAPPKVPDDAFLTADIPPPAPSNVERPVIPYSRPLHMALPFEGDLPEIPHLPYLLYTGQLVAPQNVSTIASAYANKFREEVGGCPLVKGKHRRVVPGSANDLFCFGDEEDEDWEDDVKPEVVDEEAARWQWTPQREEKRLETERVKVPSADVDLNSSEVASAEQQG
ncbi:hypothetical protein P154DRAFT_451657 [Amniculicola lignicola CBS 123094]|uniref:Glycosyltransferase 2 n=1 Tax=Amniculicola lignicola CBS 123094 TaxID=1392246 RepID=A0A6A5VYB2_9PLEO|nr:hypothetical protein P154DRAFT_451657 [Amniculicola lignicola CBS 123094]